MPNPWRKARLSGGISRLVSSIRSKRGDSSPLVVQTGFPTSLADLFVKNRSRLKKPKGGKRKQKTVPDSFGCRVSEIISAVQLRGEECGAPVVEEEIVEEGEEAVLVESGVDEEKTDLAGVSDREEVVDVPVPDRNPVSVPVSVPVPAGGRRRAFGVQSKVAVAVMVVAACSVCSSKEIVLGIMAATIGLLLLELVANRLFARMKFGGDEKKTEEVPIELDGGGEGDQYDSESSNSERRWEVEVDSDRRRVCFAEGNDLDGIRESCVVPNADVADAKTKKKHWSKHMADRLRSSPRYGNDTKGPSSGSTSRGGASDYRGSDGMILEESEEAGKGGDDDHDDNNDDNVEDVSPHMSSEEATVDYNWVGRKPVAMNNDRKIVCPKHLVLIVIVLFGLVGGRILALGLTVAWWYLVKFTGIIGKKWNVHRIGSLVL